MAAKIAALPMILTVLVVFIGCTLWTITYSFTSSRMLPVENFVGFAQYERLWSSARWNQSYKNILIYGFFSLLFTFAVGFLLAVLLDQKIRFESAFRTILLYPFALSFIITGLVWQWILNPGLGIQQFVRNLGYPDFTFNIINSRQYVLVALVLAGLWQGTGFVMTIMLAGLRGIDDEIWRATRVDGIPTWRAYLFVIIPMLRPVFITTLVFAASGIVRLYDLVVAMTGGGPGFTSDVPAKYVYDFMFQGGNLGQSMAASTMMLLTVLVVLIPWAYYEFGSRKRTER
jgi:glucose/mannose transport system permease protein